MKKFKLIISAILMLALGITLTACGGGNSGGTQTPEPPLSGENNVLVVYFSWSASHNTQTMANYIAEETDAELFRLIPETPYTDNYNEVIDIAQEEQNNHARPKLAEDLTQEQLDGYDVIFVGYPIWWYDAPIQGFEKTNFANNSFDAVITNVPFGSFKVYDKDYDRLGFYRQSKICRTQRCRCVIAQSFEIRTVYREDSRNVSRI